MYIYIYIILCLALISCFLSRAMLIHIDVIFKSMVITCIMIVMISELKCNKCHKVYTQNYKTGYILEYFVFGYIVATTEVGRMLKVFVPTTCKNYNELNSNRFPIFTMSPLKEYC